MKCLPSLILLILIPVTSFAESEGWQGEIGLLAGEHDNFFFRGEGSLQPSSSLLTGYLRLENTWDSDSGDWTLLFEADAVSVQDIAGADYQSYGLGGEYKRGKNKFSLSYAALLNRLFSESGEAVFFDENELDLWWRHSLNDRWWVRLRYQLEDWDFDPAQDGRDADVEKLALTVRFAATDTLGIRFSYLDEKRDARAPDNHRDGDGLELAFEGAPNDTTTWFLRFRRRDRAYEQAPVGDRNFARNDTTDELNFNLRWRFTPALGLYVRDNYRSGDSTRLDRNFTGNVLEAGIFFTF